MVAAVLGAFAECDEVEGTLALIGRRVRAANTKNIEMLGQLTLKIHQLETLNDECVIMRGTLAPIDRQIEESQAEIVEITISLALRTQQLAESTSERNGAQADLVLRTQQLAESITERNGAQADLVLRTQQLAESTTERNGAQADLVLRTQQLAESTTERNGAQADLVLRTQQLTESNIELEQFAYIAAHDLQEPVRTVVSFSQLLQRHLGDSLDAMSREYLSFIITGANRMGDQLRDLMSYLRVSGEQTAPVAVGLAEVVKDACDNLRNLINERGANLEIGPLPTVEGNRVLLIELFQNLLGNAIKFTSVGCTPRIKISAHRHDDLWHLAVRDQGIGIAPEYHQQIFNMFERISLGYSGTGIGLAVCKGIVERLGGRIWVESEEGRGATFIFTLRDSPTAV